MGLGISSLRLGLHARGSGAWFNTDSVGSFDFDFANSRYYYDGAFYSAWADVVTASAATFTRASTGRFYNSSGVLSSAATDVLRFNRNPADANRPRGVLIEPSRTNLLTRSEDISNGAWSKFGVTVTADQATGPDGTTTADAIVETVGSASRFILQDVSITSGAMHTISVFAQAATRSVFQLTPSSGFSVGAYQNFNLANGTLGNSSGGLPASITPVGGGIYRCTYGDTATLTGTGRFYIAFLNGDTASRAPSYTGDGSTNVYLWGVQQEVASSASSYIQTTSSSATRAADALSIVLPTGTHDLTFTFDDDSTQTISGQTGTYNVPTNLNRPNIKRAWGVLA